MAEYSKDNRFPFHTAEKSVSVFEDDPESMYELDFIWGKIIERFPILEAGPFYAKVQEIQSNPESKRVALLKDECDRLLKNIRNCLADEEFIHSLHDRWGFGID